MICLPGASHLLASVKQQDKYWERLQTLTAAVCKERNGYELDDVEASQVDSRAKFALLKQFPPSLHSIVYERLSRKIIRAHRLNTDATVCVSAGFRGKWEIH